MVLGSTTMVDYKQYSSLEEKLEIYLLNISNDLQLSTIEEGLKSFKREARE